MSVGYKSVCGIWVIDPYEGLSEDERQERHRDPADETLKTGLEWESRTLMNADRVRREAEDEHPGLDPEMAARLALCPRCQRPVWDGDRTTCELCLAWGEGDSDF